MGKNSLVVSTILLSLLVLVGFQNCQPMMSANFVTESSTGSPTLNSANELFFSQSVKPVLQTRCASCHNGSIAPLTIFTYSSMRAKLADGGTATGNKLIRKISGSDPHTGGNQCAGGLVSSDPVCGPIIQWWNKEFPVTNSGASAKVTSISQSGQILGYAMNPTSPAAILKVYFYRDNPADQGGTLIGEVTASEAGFGTYAGHLFTYDLPAAMIDNREHTLYAYAGSVSPANLIPDTPVRYATYKMTAAGIAHFNQNIQPTITSTCTRCHAFDINSGFANMLSPSPINGGTRTANNFIMNASGNGHPINGCGGGLNSGLCLAIQQWWTIEFGP